MASSAVFRQFVLKVHSRCDLACDHCYIYEHADQSWHGRSAEISVKTATRTAERIAEHARTHGLTEVTLILHGGEPLLAGASYLNEIIDALHGPLHDVCRVDLRIHTNGVLLDSQFCEVFRKHDVKVGISLDGDRTANDRHRLYRNGRSSYDKVVRSIELLRRDYPDLYSGLLCTVDIANDPIAVYESLLAHKPPAIDFLWPHHTWNQPPPRTSDTAYAEWLIEIVDRWLADGRPVPVRMFDSIISTGRGGASHTESLGLEPVDLLVVETDGGYEQADSLKTAFDGAPDTGMNVFDNAIDEVACHPGIVARQGGLAVLNATCQKCPVVATCGGGMYAHRYRDDGSGFNNPSVYCRDLRTMIEHVQQDTENLTAIALRSLATGYGNRLAIGQLKTSQIIGCRSLIATIGSQSGSSAAWELLRRLWDAESLDSVLAHPYVRVWAVDQLRESAASRTDDGRLAAIACVAAARAGIQATLTVGVRDGTIYFPTVGRYRVPGRNTTTVEIADGNLTVAGADLVDHVRRLTAGTFSVILDDLDPYRDCHDWSAAPRLNTEQFDAWQASFQEAWPLLEKEYTDYAPAIASGLTTIVPLASPGQGRSVSSAARDAFGSVGIALPESPELLCLLILHEFQHVKLGAVLDFADLYDRADDRKYHVQWRSDPRPLEGVLQGTYAHIAVADFWRRRGDKPLFDEWYPPTLAAVDTLQKSGSLTGLGEQFVAEMRTTLDSWPTL